MRRKYTFILARKVVHYIQHLIFDQGNWHLQQISSFKLNTWVLEIEAVDIGFLNGPVIEI